MMGPVQVLVVGVAAPNFSGAVLEELTRLREAGIVRLVDVLLVSRSQDGTFHTVEPPAGFPADLGQVAARFLGRIADDGDQAVGAMGVAGAVGDDAADLPAWTWSLADVVPAGSAAAVALLEHIWAAPLREAIQQAGGVPLQEAWLAPDDHRGLETLVAERGRAT